MNPLFLSFLLIITITTTTATPKIGITFDTTTKPNLTSFSSIITSLIHNKISTVHLINPTPTSIKAFSNTNITLLLTLPNTFLYSFAFNESSSATWITHNILPFYNTTHISLISINSTTHITRSHLPALRKLHTSLRKLGVNNVSVSVTFTFEALFDETLVLPSHAEFMQPLRIRPLVRFMKSTNSSFLITLYPYKVYRADYQVPVGFALFKSYPFMFRSDEVTGIKYWNLFDMMVDSVLSGLERLGEGNVPVIITETGWPSEDYFADVYLNGLMEHLRNSIGYDLLRRKRVSEVYVYELFGDEWGIMDKNSSFKYELDFSGFEAGKKVEEFEKWLVKNVMCVVIVVMLLLSMNVVAVCVEARKRKKD